jgi:hypothetical protein
MLVRNNTSCPSCGNFVFQCDIVGKAIVASKLTVFRVYCTDCGLSRLAMANVNDVLDTFLKSRFGSSLMEPSIISLVCHSASGYSHRSKTILLNRLIPHLRRGRQFLVDSEVDRNDIYLSSFLDECLRVTCGLSTTGVVNGLRLRGFDL